MLHVLTRHMPDLTGPLRGRKNAFEPWQRAGAGHA